MARTDGSLELWHGSAAMPVSSVPSLKSAVDALYAASAHRRLPKGGLWLCTECCTTPDRVQRLEVTPKADLTADDFRPYFHSANYSDHQVEERLYFLPRLLELLTHGYYASDNGVLSHFWPDLYLHMEADEVEAVTCLFGLWMDDVLSNPRSGERYVDPLDVLAACATVLWKASPALCHLASPSKTVKPLSYALLVEDAAALFDPNRDGELVQALGAVHLPDVFETLISDPVLSRLEAFVLNGDDDFLVSVASTSHEIIDHWRKQKAAGQALPERAGLN